MTRNVNWISLPEAAQRLYDALDGTPVRGEADKEPTAEARLDYMANRLVQVAPIEGRSPPSSTHRALTPKEFGAGVIKGGGKYFQRDYESYLTFIDMRVAEDDLQRALDALKAAR